MSNRTSAQSSRAGSPIDGGIRKRVGKACDRCRLKKSRCDGSTPCNKCKADNAICVYGKRKRSHDKVYPKGYVEMLEHQQAQLVLGLQELYRRSISHSETWDSEQLPEISLTHENVPRTHDLLEWLGALQLSQQEHEQVHASEAFYDDFYTMQAVAILEHPASMNREASFESTNSQFEVDQSPIFEPPTSDVWDILDSKRSSTPHISHTQLVESPQPLSKATAPSTLEATVTFSEIPWLQQYTEPQVTQTNMYNPWAFTANTQNIYTAQADYSEQPLPAELSINPNLTLRDWSALESYRSNKGFPFL